MSIEIIFSFDTTGSMNPVIESVRQNVHQTIIRLLKEIPTIEIGLIAHGDYCDIPNFFWFLPPTRDQHQLISFLEQDTSTGGGDAPECYEYILQQVTEYKWKSPIRILVMIGDEIPHPVNYRLPLRKEGFPSHNQIDWRVEVSKLKEQKVLLFGCHALPHKRRFIRHQQDQPNLTPKDFYQTISNQTGGFYFTLEELQSFPHYMLSICLKAADGVEALDLLKQERQELQKELDEMNQNHPLREKKKKELETLTKAYDLVYEPGQQVSNNNNVFCSPEVKSAVDHIRKKSNRRTRFEEYTDQVLTNGKLNEKQMEFSQQFSSW